MQAYLQNLYNLTDELKRNGYTITRHTFSEIIEKIENKDNARVTFKELFDEYHCLKTTRPFFSLDNHEELCARIALKYPLVKQAYDELGTAKVQALKYHVGISAENWQSRYGCRVNTKS